MPPSASDFAVAETAVFWDIVECPIPENLSPGLIYKNIKAALTDLGYTGNVLITAYSDMKQNPKDFESSQITLIPTGGRRERRGDILEDFMIWGFERNDEAFNAVVIAEGISKEELYLENFVFWNERNGNFLFAQPEDKEEDGNLSELRHNHASAIWHWTSLSMGGKPLHKTRLPTYTGSVWDPANMLFGGNPWDPVEKEEEEEEEEEENEEEEQGFVSSIESLSFSIPVGAMYPSPSDYAVAETAVYWDIEDCPIPKHLFPKMIYKNIKTALANMGYTGNLTITAYSDTNHSVKGFGSSQIALIREGDKEERVDAIRHHLFRWTWDQKQKPFNVMFISQDVSEGYLYERTILFWSRRHGNFLLAQPENSVSESLSEVVSAVWLWKSLSFGGKPISFDEEKNPQTASKRTTSSTSK